MVAGSMLLSFCLYERHNEFKWNIDMADDALCVFRWNNIGIYLDLRLGASVSEDST